MHLTSSLLGSIMSRMRSQAPHYLPFRDLLLLQKGEGLSEELPSFAHAQGLAVLRLNGNSFSGQLPELPASTQEVRLQRNELRGEIPRTWGFLEHLHTLKAEENKLTGSIPAGWPLPLYAAESLQSPLSCQVVMSPASMRSLSRHEPAMHICEATLRTEHYKVPSCTACKALMHS